MGKTDEDKLNVDTLCAMWTATQHKFEMDIRLLLEKSKILDTLLKQSDDSKNKTLSQKQIKLDELKVHLTEELKRRQDEASTQKRLQEWRNSMDKMRARIRVISQTLVKVGLTDKSTISKLCETQEYSQQHFEMLGQELQRCESLRGENLSVLIDHLWTEMKQWSEMTLQHPIVHKKRCTEDMLELLEQNLDDLQRYYNSNKDIFELYASRVELWTRIYALDEKANEPNHFRNRGGQLLAEERERNHINIKLPKIEEQLIQLVQDYERKLSKPFLVYGEEIMSRIANEKMCKEKDVQSEVRKQSVFDGSHGTEFRRSASTFTSRNSLSKSTSVTHYSQATVKGSLSARRQPDKAKKVGQIKR